MSQSILVFALTAGICLPVAVAAYKFLDRWEAALLSAGMVAFALLVACGGPT